MNKHIELVKKWLDDPTSVSQEELKANADAAYAAYDASYASDYAAYAYAAASAYADAAAYAYAAYAYAAAAAYDADYDYADDAAYWVKRYEELTK